MQHTECKKSLLSPRGEKQREDKINVPNGRERWLLSKERPSVLRKKRKEKVSVLFSLTDVVVDRKQCIFFKYLPRERVKRARELPRRQSDWLRS